MEILIGKSLSERTPLLLQVSFAKVSIPPDLLLVNEHPKYLCQCSITIESNFRKEGTFSIKLAGQKDLIFRHKPVKER